MDVDVSVIVPAYNAEKVIGNTIESVRNQTDLSWELLIIENGSTDRTYELCMRYASEDERIQVLRSRKGVSAARNAGITAARGEWICFLDADDFLYPAAFSSLREAAGSAETDLIVFGYDSDGGGTAADSRQEYLSGDALLAFRCEMLKNPTGCMQAWGKLFRRDTLEKGNVTFREELNMAEDADFTFRYTKHCRSICRISQILYHYMVQGDSAVRTYRAGVAEDYIRTLECMSGELSDEGEEIRSAFDQFLMMHFLLIMVHDTFAEENPADNKQKKARMKELLQNPLFADALERIKLRDLRNGRMLPVICLKYHWYGPAVIMIKSRVRQNRKKYSGQG